MVFTIRDNSSRNSELWVTDGAAAGTALVKDITPGINGSFPRGCSPVGDGRVLFRSYADASGSEPWINDGTTAGTVLINDIAPGPDRSFAGSFAPYGKNPDQDGLNFWIEQIQQGASLGQVAPGFLGSPEFVSRFVSSVPNEEFVRHIYVNVLGRLPEQDGSDVWAGSLRNGKSRPDILAGIEHWTG